MHKGLIKICYFIGIQRWKRLRKSSLFYSCDSEKFNNFSRIAEHDNIRKGFGISYFLVSYVIKAVFFEQFYILNLSGGDYFKLIARKLIFVVNQRLRATCACEKLWLRGSRKSEQSWSKKPWPPTYGKLWDLAWLLSSWELDLELYSRVDDNHCDQY